MPHDLFGDVLVRPRSVRARRSSLVILSVAAHGAAITALAIAPLLATDVLPSLPHSVTFIPQSSILPVVPAPPVLRTTKALTPAAPSAGPPTRPAPTVAPPDIQPEPELPEVISLETPGGPPSGGVDTLPSTIGAVYGQSAPPPPPPPQAPLHLHAGIRAPQKLVEVAPVYPMTAQLARVEGIVIIEATIDAHGNVIAARVLKPIALLNQAALDAVRQWKYTPTLLNGVPVPVVMTVTVNFKLR